MSMHDEYVKNIQEQAERFQREGIDLSDKVACEKEKILLCGALIKCADISNCVSFWLSIRIFLLISNKMIRQGHFRWPKHGQRF